MSEDAYTYTFICVCVCEFEGDYRMILFNRKEINTFS